MNADLAAAKAHFKGRAFGGRGALDAFPVKDTKVEIYDQRPPADAETFRKSLPLIADSQKAQVVVLFSPDLQAIGSIDNSHSKATSSYAKSVSTGFTFSSTQTIDIGAEFEAGIVIAKGKFSVGFSLSFTEQSSKTTTETVTFSVPPGEMAFTYQGTLRSQILEYDPKTDRYQYRAESRFLSPVMATTNEPIASGTKVQIVSRPTSELRSFEPEVHAAS